MGFSDSWTLDLCEGKLVRDRRFDNYHGRRHHCITSQADMNLETTKKLRSLVDIS